MCQIGSSTLLNIKQDMIAKFGLAKSAWLAEVTEWSQSSEAFATHGYAQ